MDKEKNTMFTVEPRPERVLLMGHSPESVSELAELAKTAGGEVVETVLQLNTDRFGTGKLQEVKRIAKAQDIDLAIYDDELPGLLQKEWEEEIEIPLIDRTALILDIFAGRATTKEGQLQVELAQCNYRLTRLVGKGISLSRLGGGIGTRGPGETKLETDRRHLRHRAQDLRRKLAEVKKQRQVKRKARENKGIYSLALVGYTNAGKSTLLSALSGQPVFAEDKLFATLDPLTRAVEWEGIRLLLTDTVGFVSRLPHTLVDAFRSTLEEAAYADLLLHVCDASNPLVEKQMETVEGVLAEIGAGGLPVLTVANKIDKAPPQRVKNAVFISAQTGEGLPALKAEILKRLADLGSRQTLTVPYSRPEVLAYIHETASIHSEAFGEEGTVVDFTATRADAARIAGRLKKED